MLDGRGILPPCKAKNHRNPLWISRFFNAARRLKARPDGRLRLWIQVLRKDICPALDWVAGKQPRLHETTRCFSPNWAQAGILPKRRRRELKCQNKFFNGHKLGRKQGHTLHIYGYGPVLLIPRFPVLRHFFPCGLRQQFKLLHQLLSNGRFIRCEFLQREDHRTDTLSPEWRVG